MKKPTRASTLQAREILKRYDEQKNDPGKGWRTLNHFLAVMLDEVKADLRRKA